MKTEFHKQTKDETHFNNSEYSREVSNAAKDVIKVSDEEKKTKHHSIRAIVFLKAHMEYREYCEFSW